MQPFDGLSTDVLVIGAGAAGIRAALAAAEEGAEVVILAKGPVTQSGSTFSPITQGWGIQGLLGRERTEKAMEAFYDDIIRVGLGVCEPALVRILVEESGPRLEDLLNYGLRFKMDDKRDFLRVKGCFSEYERAFLTDNPANIRDTFRAMVERSGAKVLRGMAADLIVADAACCGAWVLTEACEILSVHAKATVLATGGAAGVFTDRLVSHGECGEGYLLANRAGAGLRNLEFIQFMLGLKTDTGPRFLPLSEISRPGSLVDEEGSDILDIHLPHGPEQRAEALRERQTHYPFSSRDSSCLIDLAVATTLRDGRKVFWKNHADGSKEMEVRHFSHAFNGGLRINESGETSVSGLFAAGETAAGPHGADRIGGCMMTATQVFGQRAGRSAALRARKTLSAPMKRRPPPEIERITKGQETELLEGLGAVRSEVSRGLTVLRDRESLVSSLSRIAEAQRLLEMERGYLPLPCLNEKSALYVMELIASAALARDESLGPHFRSDFPPRSISSHVPYPSASE